MDSDLADGYFALGDLQSIRLKFADARRSYLRALELEPSHDGAMDDLANVYVALGRYDEALDWALRAAQLDPNHPHAPYHVGLPLIALGDDSATARYLHAAERKRPAELRVQGLLAWLEMRRGAPAAALARARRMVADNPDNTEGRPILAELAFLAGAPEAEQLLKPLVDGRSGDTVTIRRRGPALHVCPDPASNTVTAGRPRSCGGSRPRRRGSNSPPARKDRRHRWSWPRSTRSRATRTKRWTGSKRAIAPDGRTPRQLELDPFFAPVRQDPRYRAVLTNMRQDVAEMRRRAAAAHPELFPGTTP